MAKRRAISKAIIDDDVFLDMPISAQGLYFHLILHADDFGFVGPKKIMRMIGSSSDDLSILIAKRYLLQFPSGVVVIKHWPAHDTIKADRLMPTTYQKEFNQLTKNEWGVYTEKLNMPDFVAEIEPETKKLITGDVVKESQYHHVKPTTSQRGSEPPPEKNVSKMSPQVKLSKVKLSNKHTTAMSQNDMAVVIKIIDFYNQTFGRKILATAGRKQKIKLRLKTFSTENIVKAIINASKDDFFNGGGSRGWIGDLDYLIRSDENIERYLLKTAVASERRYE